MPKDKPVKEIEDAILLKHPYMFTNPQGYCIACSPKDIHRLKGGGFKVDHGAPMKFGLQKGSSDMIGWEEIIVTPEMVGKKVAIFQSIEIKTLNDKLRVNQKTWNKIVQQCGGIVKVWHALKDGTIDENSKIY